MSSSFDASASLLGYIYQLRAALLDALTRCSEQASFSVAIESLDDISFFDGNHTPTDLIQTKHHLNSKGSLSDRSTDLWKTIRVWSEYIKTHNTTSEISFNLITTEVATSNTISSMLTTSEQRDPASALDQMIEIAREASSGTNKDCYRSFLALDNTEKNWLVNRICILDGASDISAIDSKLKGRLALTVNSEQVESFITRLEGWWFRRTIKHLHSQNSTPVRSEEIHAELERLRNQFKNDNLPIDDDLLEIEEIDESAFESDVFVQQLRWIDLSAARIITAMRNFYRAKEQRSRWLREGFLQYGELTRYDNKLCEEWKIQFDEMIDVLSNNKSEDSIRIAVLTLYRWAEQGVVSNLIREACREPFIPRGTLQILSDGSRIGWHPEFRKKLLELLEDSEEAA